jgi:hypothetical protein
MHATCVEAVPVAVFVLVFLGYSGRTRNRTQAPPSNQQRCGLGLAHFKNFILCSLERNAQHTHPTSSNVRGSSCRIGGVDPPASSSSPSVRWRFAAVVGSSVLKRTARRGVSAQAFTIGHRRTTFAGFETIVDQSELGRQNGDSMPPRRRLDASEATPRCCTAPS